MKAHLNYRESEGSQSVTLRKPTLRYLDEFVKLKCCIDLLSWHVFPNAKEITESMAAYQALRRFMASRLNDPEVQCLVVGDGHTPRTGALIACRSSWQVTSVDPVVTPLPQCYRLTTIPKRIEEAHFPKPDVVIAVHSHAQYLPNAPLVISIPCCIPDPPNDALTWTYEDWGIHSPKRTVNIYRSE